MSYPRWRAARRIVGAAALVALLCPAGYVGVRMAASNFDVVEPGRTFRSGQMPRARLREAIRAHRIRTVFNLRGANADRPWYRDELLAAREAGATHVDVSMATDHWLSREQAATIVEVLDRSEHPILIHCQWGAERTGLVSAFVELLRPGGSVAAARGQFAARFLFVPSKDGAVMTGHLDRYEAWLRSRGESHDPARFRLWVAEGYVPGRPSREYWPRDPYPRLVVSRPEAAVAGWPADAPVAK